MRAFEGSAFFQGVDQQKRFAFVHLQFELGRAKRGGQCFKSRTGVSAARQDFQQARTGVEAIIKPEPAFLEKNMTAHFASKWRTCFCQFGFDQRVPGAAHQWLTAGLGDG